MEKPRFVHISVPEQSSFMYDVVERLPGDSFVYHVHPEIQLQYVERGHGHRLIGGVMEPFTEGSVVLVPGNVPHVWCYSVRNGEQPVSSRFYMIQFLAEKLAVFMNLVPEFRDHIQFITGLKDAIEIKGKAAETIARQMKAMSRQNAFERYISFLRVLKVVVEAPEIRYLNVGQLNAENPRYTSRIQQIYGYLEKNHDRNFSLEEIATSVGMNKSSFCKFFKQVTGMTFTESLNNMRISKAALMLGDNPSMSISEIAYSVGYDSLSHFNHMFQKIKGESPTSYRARFKSDQPV